MAVKKLETVEAGRGFAAILVVLFHVEHFYFGVPKYWTFDPVHGLFAFGHAGVEFFFVLSGYIMLTVHQRDIGQASKVVPFLKKRFNRIYPFFWMVLAITLAMFWIVPEFGKPSYRDPLIILQSIVLAGQEPLHAVVFTSWTLWYEVIFYAFCAIVIGAPRLGLPLFLAWMLACLGLQFTGLQTSWPPYLTAFINLLFGVGAAAGLWLSRGTIPAPRLFLAAGLVIFLGTGVYADYGPPLPEWVTHLAFGLGSAAALVGAVQLEKLGKLRVPRALVLLGSASFAIYLTHMLVLPVVAKACVLLHLTRLLPAWAGMVLLACSAVGAGLVIHLVAERKILRLMQRILPSKTTPNEPGLAPKPSQS